MNIRVGIGYDIHRLRKGKGLRLGGILVPCAQELVGHSDADVLIHAICDALLGAIGAGDMGTYFPDRDERFRGKESSWFLEQVAKKVNNQGFQVLQIDSVVIAEGPKLLAYRDQMQENLATLLKIPRSQISIKAKTNERLDSIGSRKAIAAWAVSLVRAIKMKGER